jgi:hypothetical protein
MDEFNESLQKIGEHIYAQAGANAGSGSGGSGSSEGSDGAGSTDGEPKKKEEDVVDADYREVN